VALITIRCQTEASSPGGAVEQRQFDLSPAKISLLKTTKREAAGVKLDTANIVVSLGRGLKAKDDLRIISDLAKALNGEMGTMVSFYGMGINDK
jgi:electron transfer flavoprotein alpha subunit